MAWAWNWLTILATIGLAVNTLLFFVIIRLTMRREIGNIRLVDAFDRSGNVNYEVANAAFESGLRKARKKRRMLGAASGFWIGAVFHPLWVGNISSGSVPMVGVLLVIALGLTVGGALRTPAK